IAEITRTAAEDFALRYHPDQYERFMADSEQATYPVYLDFENILSGLEATPAYQTLLKVARAQTIDNMVEKCFIASFVVLHNLRSHSVMNAMIELNKEMGFQKFEHLVTLKWMLSDPNFLFRMVHPILTSHWSLYTSTEHLLPLCDSPILVQPQSVMVALSPRLLLKIDRTERAQEDQMPTCQRIGTEELEEHRNRTIGNTFREIIGEPEQLERLQASPEFHARAKIMREVKCYNKLIKVSDAGEIWHINAFANQR
ncbi:MAG: hypothetical protein LBI76_02660, partial [Comamonas sp.]|nr:hypothetical protein [Comamonas sp.]